VLKTPDASVAAFITPDAWSWESNIGVLFPNFSYDGYREILGGKQPGRDDNHPPHLAPRLKKEYTLDIDQLIALLYVFKIFIYN